MPTPAPNVDRLISRYLSHLASPSERQELEEWLQASPMNREVFEQLKKIWYTSPNVELKADRSALRDRLWQAVTKRPLPARPVFNTFYWSKVAASFLILLVGMGLFSYLIKESISSEVSVALPPAVAWVEKTNLAGQKSVHRLPDNTQVWLNAESSLMYPEKFADTLRLVQLQGEAFFEVAPDQQRPFVVEAAETRTQALGTAFNIHAYPEDSVVTIALWEGKVQVQKVEQVQNTILSPGNELLIAKDKEAFELQLFNYERTLGWKEGILIFDGADFTEFRQAIERWYGVKVAVAGMVPTNWRIQARYQREDLRHVLRDISFNKNIKFELKDKNVLITF